MGSGRGKTRRAQSAAAAKPAELDRDSAGFAALLKTLDPPKIDERWAEAIEPASRMQQQASGLFATYRQYARFYNSEHKQAVEYREQAKKKQEEAHAL